MVKISEYFLFQEGVIASFVPYFSFLFASIFYCTITEPYSWLLNQVQHELLKLPLLRKDVIWMVLHGKFELNLEQKASK